MTNSLLLEEQNMSSSNAKPVKYHLEIHLERDFEHPFVAYSASTPFMAINVGDKFDGRTWEGIDTDASYLEVTRVEHIIWEGEQHIGHKIVVDTKPAKRGR